MLGSKCLHSKRFPEVWPKVFLTGFNLHATQPIAPTQESAEQIRHKKVSIWMSAVRAAPPVGAAGSLLAKRHGPAASQGGTWTTEDRENNAGAGESPQTGWEGVWRSKAKLMK